MYFEPLVYISAILYLLGCILHYVHVLSVFYLTDEMDNMDPNKTRFMSLLWPVNVVSILWDMLTGKDVDEEDD